jgi:hypothetical protein
VKHSELERQLEGMGRELMRKLLQAHLRLAPAGPSGGSGAGCRGHAAHANRRRMTRSLESIFGTVEVARTGYGAAGTAQSAPA